MSRDLYNQEAQIEVQNISKKQIDGGKTQEHVVFKVILQDKASDDKSKQKCQTLVPSFPSQFKISAEQFCGAFPYHLIFDDKMKIQQCGLSIQRLINRKVKPGSNIHDFFSMTHPRMKFTVENIRVFINTVFMLAVKNGSNGDTRLTLKGEGNVNILMSILHLLSMQSQF